MGAKRVLLTHFSQRYQKIPSMGSMESVGVRLEDAEEVEDSMDVMEPPVNAEDEPLPKAQAPATDSNKAFDQEEAQHAGNGDAEPQSCKTSSTDPTFASRRFMNILIRPPTHDMKIGVAFDYMRIKVGDIMHLEKFTPALRELYKEAEKEEADEKARRAAKEAFSDDEKDVSPLKSRGSGTIPKQDEGTKANKAISRWERKKEKTKIYSENDEGEAEGEDASTPPISTMLIEDDGPAPALNGIGTAQGFEWKHFKLDHSTDATPPDATTSEIAAAGGSAPNASAPHAQAIDDTASSASKREGSGDESERSTTSSRTRFACREKYKVIQPIQKERNRMARVERRNSEERSAGQTVSGGVAMDVQSDAHPSVRQDTQVETGELWAKEEFGQEQVLFEHQLPEKDLDRAV